MIELLKNYKFIALAPNTPAKAEATAITTFTLYAHQTKRVAKVGEYVSAGDLIGYVGSTGDSTGNHLHFEIRYNDNRLDPLQFFE